MELYAKRQVKTDFGCIFRARGGIQESLENKLQIADNLQTKAWLIQSSV